MITLNPGQPITAAAIAQALQNQGINATTPEALNRPAFSSEPQAQLTEEQTAFLQRWDEQGKPYLITSLAEEDEDVQIWVETGFGHMIAVEKHTGMVHMTKGYVIHTPTRVIIDKDYFSSTKGIWK